MGEVSKPLTVRVQVHKFLGARLGYQLLKLGSPMQFVVASGYQATTKSYTGDKRGILEFLMQVMLPVVTIRLTIPLFCLSSVSTWSKKCHSF